MKKKELKQVLSVLGKLPVTKMEPEDLSRRLVETIVSLNRQNASLELEIKALDEQYYQPHKERLDLYANAVRQHSDLTPFQEEKNIDATFSAAFHTIMEEPVDICASFSAAEIFEAAKSCGAELTGDDFIKLSPVLS